ncbi:MAG: hypothetical protein RR313_10750, partial [Anaerovoracaceae bacterium]
MGYKSEVGIVLKKPDYEKLVCMAKENLENGVYETLKYADKIIDLDEKVAIHFEWIKWYETIDGIGAVMDFLYEEADGYGFVEVGEDTNDITTEYSDSEDGTGFYDDVEVRREVCFP